MSEHMMRTTWSNGWSWRQPLLHGSLYESENIRQVAKLSMIGGQDSQGRQIQLFHPTWPSLAAVRKLTL
jgi:hypothetical protein